MNWVNTDSRTARRLRRSFAVSAWLASALCVCQVHADPPDVNFHTSPIDITGGRLQIQKVIPDRETGSLVATTIPASEFGVALGLLSSTPLNELFDSYWNAPSTATGESPRQFACDNPDQGVMRKVTEAVNNIGLSPDSVANHERGTYSAYGITCDFATTGQLLAQPIGPFDVQLGYELLHNVVKFRIRTPDSCRVGVGLCPNDPLITVTFAIEIATSLRVPGICEMSGGSHGNVFLHGVSIDTHNAAAVVAHFFSGRAFAEAEAGITASTNKFPLPLNSALASVRSSDACKNRDSAGAKLLQAVNGGFDIDINPNGVVFRLLYPAVIPPTIDGPNELTSATQSGSEQKVPSFAKPILVLQPRVAAGAILPVKGVFFPPSYNFSSSLPLVIRHGDYRSCSGDATYLQWGPKGGTVHIDKLPNRASDNCADTFVASNLTRSTDYEFRARDCNVYTCSVWGPQFKARTDAFAKTGSVTLKLDGIVVGRGPIFGKGTFETAVAVPVNTSVGTHVVQAVTCIGAAGRLSRCNANALPAATADVVVTAAGGGAPTLTLVRRFFGESGCPNHVATDGIVNPDAPFPLFGSGFAPGIILVYLDARSGRPLGTASVNAGRTFCNDFRVSSEYVQGPHQLIAVQGGVVQSTAPITIRAVPPIR